MKITLIREERESGKEAVSTQKTDMLMEKLKTENKTGYITELRSIIPHLKGTNARYEHIDRLPRLYPAVEMTRTKAGEHRIKTYNGLILLEVNNLAGVAEAELVKQQAALLPQTFAAFCGSSGRSAKIWVRFTLPDGGLPKNEDDIALIPRPRLPPGSEVLPTPSPFPHHPPGSFTPTKLPDDRGRTALL